MWFPTLSRATVIILEKCWVVVCYIFYLSFIFLFPVCPTWGLYIVYTRTISSALVQFFYHATFVGFCLWAATYLHVRYVTDGKNLFSTLLSLPDNHLVVPLLLCSPLSALVAATFFLGTIYDSSMREGIPNGLYSVTMYYCFELILFGTVGMYKRWFPMNLLLWKTIPETFQCWWEKIVVEKVKNLDNNLVLQEVLSYQKNGYVNEWNEVLFESLTTFCDLPESTAQEIHGYHNPQKDFIAHLPALRKRFAQLRAAEERPWLLRYLRWVLHNCDKVMWKYQNIYVMSWNLEGRKWKKDEKKKEGDTLMWYHIRKFPVGSEEARLQEEFDQRHELAPTSSI